MKILIFINSLGAGGAERSMVEFAKFLKDSNILVKFVCLERRKVGLETEVKDYGIETIYFDISKSGIKQEVNFVVNVIKNEDPDILHSVLAKSNLVLRLSRFYIKKGKLIQSLVNTPYSLERKKDTNLAWQKFLVMKQVDKWSARLTKNIFYHAITNEVLEHYRPLFNIKDNFKIIYRGRNENSSTEITKNSNFTILNSGRQEFAKGQIDILKALKYIEDKYGIRDIYLEILGREGGYTKKINTFIDENRLKDMVTIKGFVSNVEESLSKSHLFIFPSYYEGLGGALIEAFAAKLPCICSDIPVLREVVGKEDGALFSPPGDYKELAENILKLYREEELRNKLSTHSYSRFQEAFRMETINKEMLNMYKEILGSK